MTAEAIKTGTPAAESKRRNPVMSKKNRTFYAEGEPMVWLTGGALGTAVLMITSMLLYVALMGASNFWPHRIVEVHTVTGERYLGEITRQSSYQPTPANLKGLPEDHLAGVQAKLALSDGFAQRNLIRTGNYDLTGTRFHWVSDYRVQETRHPEWAVAFERMEWGNFYGTPRAFIIDGEVVADSPEAVWAEFKRHHDEVRERRQIRKRLETLEIGRANRAEEKARLTHVGARNQHAEGVLSDAGMAEATQVFQQAFDRVRAEHARITAQIQELNRENGRFSLLVDTVDGRQKALHLADIIRAHPANQLTFLQKTGVFLSRWREFLLDDPREANQEGGVFPAIIGTVTMTLVMTLFVVPFGVLAALYLREYAKSGPMVSAVRISINNLAGVPSIVFGVFGLGFFCYIFGGYLDEWFYAARLPAPTFRKGGVFWSSLTLALLTLPVVIVATEEALAAVPSSMREGSYACGGSKWQTIKRIVLPRAMPGIMTGMILAMARGAGEVAPLMLVGAVKLAPDLPFDFHNWSGSLGPLLTGPIHLDRSFMHLGFHIYDVGFQSPDSEAARPMVFTTTLLLIGIIVVLNISAMLLRTRLRKRFMTGAF